VVDRVTADLYKTALRKFRQLRFAQRVRLPGERASDG
jgi:hypothetical protein